MPPSTDQMSQEELQAYVEQLRSADPAEVIAQAFTMLATGAEVKVGRSDARVLIDALGGIVQATEGKVPGNLTAGMRNGVSQLQMAQVDAERSHAQEQSSREAPASGSQPGADAGQQKSDLDEAGQRMTDRLWIPGRGPPPPKSS